MKYRDGKITASEKVDISYNKMRKMIYEEIKPQNQEKVEATIEQDNPDELLYVPIAVSLHESDLTFAQGICLKLSAHEHFNVRGNAILGFSHLARRFRKLDFEDLVKSLIEDALKDPNDYVRGHADTAADDLEHFLNWKINRPDQV